MLHVIKKKLIITSYFDKTNSEELRNKVDID